MRTVRWLVSAWTAGCLGTLWCAAARADGDRLLIIAPREFHGALGEFVAYKQQRRPTDLVALGDVLAWGTGEFPGADDPEKLKRFLYAAWKERGTRYVLLVGDADVMPVRYMVLDRVTAPAFDYAFYPSDLYYADLAEADGSFDDWNGAKDGFHGAYYGEVRGEKNKSDPINYDGVDYRPDVALGRWPVSSPEQAAAVAVKSMAYEKAVEAGGVPTRAALVMVGGWIDARPRMDEWAGKLPAGWTTEKRYYHEGKEEPPHPTPSEAEVVGLLNSGVGLVLHAGHGSDDVWEGCLSTGSLAKVSNAGRTPVMISAGCSTARFATLPPYEAYADVSGVEHTGTDRGEVFSEPPPPPACYAKGTFNKTGLGERLVRDGPDGAVAYIGCNTGSQPCGLTLAEGFVDGMTKAERETGAVLVGDCWAHAVAYYYEREGLGTIVPDEGWYPASIFFQGMKFMLFGDPTLPMAGTAATQESRQMKSP
ncbi:MAG: C25 family cysteine peptidase [Phycisphaerales bacterium]